MTADERNLSPQTSSPETSGTLQSLSGRAVPKKKSKKKTIAIIVALVLLAVILGVMYVIGSRHVMKDVLYDNGLGGKYEMKFYDSHTKKKVPDSVGVTESHAPVDIEAMYAQRGASGKAPLGVIVSGSPAAADPAAYDSLKDCKSLPVAMTVHNEYAGQDLKVCVVQSDGKDVMYLVAMKDGDTVHKVTFLQDMGQSMDKANKVENEVDVALKSIGLKVYRNEVRDILSSLRPLK
jgi:hypothetical protein